MLAHNSSHNIMYELCKFVYIKSLVLHIRVQEIAIAQNKIRTNYIPLSLPDVSLSLKTYGN
jgi:hypothetical protein